MLDTVPPVKPAIRGGRTQVGKKGVARDPETWRDVLETAPRLRQPAAGQLAGLERSPAPGPAGNVEFLADLVRDRRDGISISKFVDAPSRPRPRTRLFDPSRPGDSRDRVHYVRAAMKTNMLELATTPCREVPPRPHHPYRQKAVEEAEALDLCAAFRGVDVASVSGWDEQPLERC